MARLFQALAQNDCPSNSNGGGGNRTWRRQFLLGRLPSIYHGDLCWISQSAIAKVRFASHAAPLNARNVDPAMCRRHACIRAKCFVLIRYIRFKPAGFQQCALEGYRRAYNANSPYSHTHTTFHQLQEARKLQDSGPNRQSGQFLPPTPTYPGLNDPPRITQYIWYIFLPCEER